MEIKSVYRCEKRAARRGAVRRMVGSIGGPEDIMRRAAQRTL